MENQEVKVMVGQRFPERVVMPKRLDGTAPPDPIRWRCELGHLHKTRDSAIECARVEHLARGLDALRQALRRE